MNKKKNIFLNRKRSRDLEEPKGMELKIGKENKNFDLISYKLNKANKLFHECRIMKTKEEKRECIKNVIDLVEINPQFNFEFLKYHTKENQSDYEYDFNQLSPTLSENDYFLLTKKKQKNPAKELFDLLNLYITDENEFEEEIKNIKNNKYNIPLIEGNERIRINYYLQLFPIIHHY